MRQRLFGGIGAILQCTTVKRKRAHDRVSLRKESISFLWVTNWKTPPLRWSIERAKKEKREPRPVPSGEVGELCCTSPSALGGDRARTGPGMHPSAAYRDQS